MSIKARHLEQGVPIHTFILLSKWNLIKDNSVRCGI